MQLVLLCGNKGLDRVTVDPALTKNADYLNALRELLVVKHELTIIAMQEAPEFYLEAPSSMNGQEKDEDERQAL